jgi:alpha-tubulin suppressor-like RCC1 family protein
MEVSGGLMHTCVVTPDGGVECTGGNFYGQLADATNGNALSLTAVQGLPAPVVSVSCGEYHTCVAMFGASGARCWGGNFHGQLTGSEGGSFNSPMVPPGLELVQGGFSLVRAHFDHTCLITTEDAMVVCFGKNANGQLGRSNQGGPLSAALFANGVSGVTELAVGMQSTYIYLAATHTVHSLGNDFYGQLGTRKVDHTKLHFLKLVLVALPGPPTSFPSKKPKSTPKTPTRRPRTAAPSYPHGSITTRRPNSRTTFPSRADKTSFPFKTATRFPTKKPRIPTSYPSKRPTEANFTAPTKSPRFPSVYPTKKPRTGFPTPRNGGNQG